MVKGRIGLIGLVLVVISVLFISISANNIQGIGNNEMLEDINIEVSIPDVETPIFIEEGYVEEEIVDVAVDEIIEEVIKKEVDYTSFNACYNKVVATAQLEMGNSYALYESWFKENVVGISENIDWSVAFLSWCSSQAGITDIIPIVSTCEELKVYYSDIDSYYRGAEGCYPHVGDIVLFDMNKDNIPDHAELISYYNKSEGKLITVGGYKFDEETQTYIISESNYNPIDGRIYGICRPQYDLNRIENYYTIDVPFNAVDTVVRLTKQEYADCLAENGIELIARYINPEGRNPLTVEEAQMYSNAGIRVMMIYQINKDDPYKGYDVGVEFGTKALEYARNLGAPKGTPIFFCCDCNNRPEYFCDLSAFILGVKDAMQGEYSVGLYGGYYTCEAMYNVGLIDYYWQCWGFSDRYISDNYDILQWSTGYYYFDEIPYKFDANHVKNIEEISYIMPKSN